MRILVTGSRNWSDVHTIEVAIRAEALRAIPAKVPTVIVHGACPTGADAIADVLAPRMGLAVERHPADWDNLRAAAGPIRNQEMVDSGADICLAFLHPDSRGTVDCVKRAKRAGIPVREFFPSDLDERGQDCNV